jgi:hypothetical protein
MKETCEHQLRAVASMRADGAFGSSLAWKAAEEIATLRRHIAELERTEHKVSDVREAMAYRLEKVWGEDLVVIADLLSWEWHKPSFMVKEMRNDLYRLKDAVDLALLAYDSEDDPEQRSRAMAEVLMKVANRV